MKPSSLLASMIALASFWCTSCESGPIDVEIDRTFDVARKVDIRKAGSAWNDFTARKFVFIDGGEWLIVYAAVPLGFNGHTDAKRQLIRIDYWTPADETYAVALHELGHALGLGHVIRGVMDPTRQTIRFSDEDLEECRNVGAC